MVYVSATLSSIVSVQGLNVRFPRVPFSKEPGYCQLKDPDLASSGIVGPGKPFCVKIMYSIQHDKKVLFRKTERQNTWLDIDVAQPVC